MDFVISIICLAIGVFIIYSGWKVFEKAGQPGWAVIVPIYGFYILLKIAGKPGWWLIPMLIPPITFIVFILVSISVAQAFGKGTGFGLGLAFLGFIFLPILAFSDAQYRPVASGVPVATPAA
jgi:hypothetical protein